MAAASDWLSAWWALQLARKPDPDPGVPAYYGTALGAPTPAPVSYVAAATTTRYPALINLDKVHRRVYRLLGVPHDEPR